MNLNSNNLLIRGPHSIKGLLGIRTYVLALHGYQHSDLWRGWAHGVTLVSTSCPLGQLSPGKANEGPG